MDDKNRQWGGCRKGAGRPKGTGRLYAFRADGDIADFIDRQDNKTEFIKGCIGRVMSSASGSEGSFHIPGLGSVVSADRVEPFTLPFFDISLVAGFPIPLDNDELAQDIELVKMLCPHPESSYLIRVSGNSMIDSGINDGDILIVDKSNRCPSEHQAAVCELNGEYTVKRVLEDEKGFWLVPSNPDYPRMRVRAEDQFSVWGVVTYVIHKPQF